MKTNMLVVTAIAVAGAIGCNSAQGGDTATSGSEVVVQPTASESIASLNALKVVDFGLKMAEVGESRNCYGSQVFTSIGMTCPADLDALHDQIALGDAHLKAFSDAAVAAAAAVTEDSEGDKMTVSADISALRALDIVAVADFQTSPEETGNCYVLFCSDQDRMRAKKLHAIVGAAQSTK